MIAKFLKSASALDQCPQDDCHEVCLIGRSNVGKSSFINALVSLKIAKTSNTPGRTQTLNFYEYKNWRIVDLPGYGYAKISKLQKDLISDFISDYLNYRANLKAIFQIIDAGVITQQDADMIKIISQTDLQHFVVANKIDKLNQSELHNLKRKIATYLKISETNIFLTSTKTKKNFPEIIKQMEVCLK
ncbi:ribosome biogenesis GTP-binding protein YihA/YsxC [[Mycoplasma] testudinis]|uniref:ribosome biogenesis GTP-binding protein YihA/YsxC n=1 Tax=[Mycoplasma] testudinis TaxID=33924 RepID=UPI000696070E|nr:ribosome biogenesis GTP-binding protein YihA/YsxC [[Mycoplasma] testudinis]